MFEALANSLPLSFCQQARMLLRMHCPLGPDHLNVSARAEARSTVNVSQSVGASPAFFAVTLCFLKALLVSPQAGPA